MQLDLFVLEEQYNILEGDELQTCKTCQKENPYTYFTKPKLISQVMILGVRVVEKNK